MRGVVRGKERFEAGRGTRYRAMVYVCSRKWPQGSPSFREKSVSGPATVPFPRTLSCLPLPLCLLRLPNPNPLTPRLPPPTNASTTPCRLSAAHSLSSPSCSRSPRRRRATLRATSTTTSPPCRPPPPPPRAARPRRPATTPAAAPRDRHRRHIACNRRPQCMGSGGVRGGGRRLRAGPRCFWSS